MATTPPTERFTEADSLAELLITFIARYGLENVPALLANMDSDKDTLRQALAELKAGGASEALLAMVREAIKATKRREPVHVTARKRREEQRHEIFVTAHRKNLKRDLDVPINKRGTSWRKRFGRKP